MTTLAAKLRVPMRDRRLCLVHVRRHDHRLSDVLMLASQSGVRRASRADESRRIPRYSGWWVPPVYSLLG